MEGTDDQSIISSTMNSQNLPPGFGLFSYISFSSPYLRLCFRMLSPIPTAQSQAAEIYPLLIVCTREGETEEEAFRKSGSVCVKEGLCV